LRFLRLVFFPPSAFPSDFFFYHNVNLPFPSCVQLNICEGIVILCFVSLTERSLPPYPIHSSVCRFLVLGRSCPFLCSFSVFLHCASTIGKPPTFLVPLLPLIPLSFYPQTRGWSVSTAFFLPTCYLVSLSGCSAVLFFSFLACPAAPFFFPFPLFTVIVFLSAGFF